MGSLIPRYSRVLHTHRNRREAIGSGYRIQRGRPAGDHGRSELARRRLLRQNTPIPGRPSPMLGHITYLSDESMRNNGRRLRGKENMVSTSPQTSKLKAIQAPRESFIHRFDANSYLYITKSDRLLRPGGGHDGLAAAFGM